MGKWKIAKQLILERDELLIKVGHIEEELKRRKIDYNNSKIIDNILNDKFADSVFQLEK